LYQTYNRAGHKTSLSLEDAFWLALKDIAWSRRMTLRDLIGRIYSERTYGNLSSPVRLFVLNYHKERAEVTARAANAKELRPQLGLLNGVS
jgi:predicted DNA-binding ribbon-helix-helix protein